MGSIIMAMIARRIKSYTKTMRTSALGVTLLFIPLLYLDCRLSVSLGIVFVIGFFTGAQVLGFACAKNNSTPELSGTTIALTNCIVMLLGSLFQPIVGVLLDTFWNGLAADDGSRIYDVSCYTKAIIVIPILTALSYAISTFMKETMISENSKDR
jgi:hypothetical protein